MPQARRPANVYHCVNCFYMEGAICVIKNDIEYCQFRIAEEERLANQAPSPETRSGHSQLAMLYRSQLTALFRSLGPHEQVF